MFVLASSDSFPDSGNPFGQLVQAPVVESKAKNSMCILIYSVICTKNY